MRLIGLSGYAGSGKNVASRVLEEFGYRPISLAAIFKHGLYLINPIVGVQGNELVRLRDVAKNGDMDAVKDTPFADEVRVLMQRTGTEFGRDLLGENIWLDTMFNSMDPGAKYVITDVRFPNEYNAIMNTGGQVWRIERPGIGPKNKHVSELSMEGLRFTRTIVNDKDVETFRENIRSIVPVDE